MTASRRAAVDRAMAAIAELLAERRRSSMAWLRGCDISMGQLHVLATLQEHDTMTVGALADALSISAPSASSIVDRLVERGLVGRERCEEDRRTVRLSLSPQGRRFIGELHGLGAEQLRGLLGELDDADLGALTRLAGLLREAGARVGRNGASAQSA